MENERINPWRAIWIHPRKTMRAILDKNPNWLVLLLAIVGGAVIGLTFSSMIWQPMPPRDLFHKILLLATLIIAGIIVNLLQLYINGWLIGLTGSWLGGKGKFIEVKSAVGWSNYPAIFTNLALIITQLSRPHLWLMTIFAIIHIILAIWSFIISISLLAEAHRYSFWRSLGAIIIAGLLIAAVIVIIAVLIPLISPLFK